MTGFTEGLKNEARRQITIANKFDIDEILSDLDDLQFRAKTKEAMYKNVKHT